MWTTRGWWEGEGGPSVNARCPALLTLDSPLFGTLCRLRGLAGQTGKARRGAATMAMALSVPQWALSATRAHMHSHTGPSTTLTPRGTLWSAWGTGGDLDRLTPKPSSVGLSPAAPPDGQGQPGVGLWVCCKTARASGSRRLPPETFSGAKICSVVEGALPPARECRP